MKTVLIGAGTYGQVYAAYLSESHVLHLMGFLDDDPAKQGREYVGLKVLGSIADLPLLKEQGARAVVAPLGNNSLRVRVLAEAKSLGLETPTYIHPRAIVGPGTTLGDGVYVLPGSVIMPFVTIEDYVMISMGANICHHARIRRGAFISNGVNVGAATEIGERAFLGMGCTVMTGVASVGVGAVVGAGAVVIRNVAEGATVAGVPAKALHGDLSGERGKAGA